jgi:hypothetical protein
MDDGGRISLLSKGGLGHLPEDPLVLVIQLWDPEVATFVSLLPDFVTSSESDHGTLVYYRLYAQEGAIQSKHPVSTDDPSLARIMSLHVAPPHTVGSLKCCICKYEGIADHESAHLFTSVTSQSAMDDGGRISLLSDGGLGHLPEDPLALVIPLQDPEAATFVALLPNIATALESDYGTIIFLPRSSVSDIVSQSIIEFMRRMVQSLQRSPSNLMSSLHV